MRQKSRSIVLFHLSANFQNVWNVVFCDISRAFDRVWHDGLLLKSQQCGITGCLLCWFRSYLTERFQRVVLNGCFPFLNPGRVVVLQGSILGPLLFLFSINYIVIDVNACTKVFADDSSRLRVIVETPDPSMGYTMACPIYS